MTYWKSFLKNFVLGNNNMKCWFVITLSTLSTGFLLTLSSYSHLTSAMFLICFILLCFEEKAPIKVVTGCLRLIIMTPKRPERFGIDSLLQMSAVSKLLELRSCDRPNFFRLLRSFPNHPNFFISARQGAEE